MSTPVAVIDGRSGRKIWNALTLTFLEGDTPFATAVQGAGDSFGMKAGILFGLRNGRVGNNELTYTDGTKLYLPTRDEGPTPLTLDGTVIATITRAATSAAALPDGTPLLSFVPHPEGGKTDDRYRMLVLAPAGDTVATLDVMRSPAGWGFDTDDLLDLVSGDFGGNNASSLPIPFGGTRLVLFRDVSPVERHVLLAACAEICLSARPYVAEMGTQGAAWM